MLIRNVQIYCFYLICSISIYIFIFQIAAPIPTFRAKYLKKNEEWLKISAQYCMPVIMAVSGYI